MMALRMDQSSKACCILSNVDGAAGIPALERDPVDDDGVARERMTRPTFDPLTTVLLVSLPCVRVSPTLFKVNRLVWYAYQLSVLY